MVVVGSSTKRHMEMASRAMVKENPRRHASGVGKPGHLKDNCWAIINGEPGPGANGRPQQQSNFASGNGMRQGDRHVSELDDEPGVIAGAAGESALRRASDGDGGEGGDPRKTIGPSGSWWCFDTGSNVHLTGDKSLFVDLEEIDPQGVGATVMGVAATAVTQASGIGRVKIVAHVEGTDVEFFLDEVLYLEGAELGLFSMHLAIAQGFDVSYDRTESTFNIYKEWRQIIHAVPEQGIWVFNASGADSAPPRDGVPRAIVNYTIADGVATLQQWHERTNHTNVQYLKLMVDRGLVRGMMLSKRQAKTCDSCHIGKQRQKRRQKKLDRKVAAPNQIVYADLLFPPRTTALVLPQFLSSWTLGVAT
jgi:hypothetical protein